MLNNKVSRRTVVKTSAAAAVVTGVGLSTSLTASAKSLPVKTQINKASPQQYIINVLENNFRKSKSIDTAQIKKFAYDFVANYQGQLNLKRDYSGIAGEYKLVRQFVKSGGVHQG